MPTITITQFTPLKSILADAKDIPTAQKNELQPGQIKVTSLPTELDKSHIYVQVIEPLKATGYIFIGHTDYTVPDTSAPTERANISNYRISSYGLDLVKEFEGKRLKTYCCTSGVLTIGYGHTKGVRSGQTCSDAQADEWLREDIRWFEDKVKQIVTVELTQYQFDALVSYAFNCGGGALQASNTLRLINAEKFKEAAREWVKGWEREAPGILRRRKAEVVLFES